MNELFWNVVSVSIGAGWLILAVTLLRFLLKKAPKTVRILLWALVAVRLLLPVTIESELSLVPQYEVSRQIVESRSAEKDAPATSFDTEQHEAQNQPSQMPDIPVRIPKDTGLSYTNENTQLTVPKADALQPPKTWDIIDVLPIIWVSGLMLILLYGAVGYLRLSRKLRTAVILESNIYCTDCAGAPFVFGIGKSKIYIPYNMCLQDMEHVIAHEKVHIARKDHWTKLLAYLLLAVYWFHPLVWLAYVLLCRDMELACDERVVKNYDPQQRADYSQALLSCSVHKSKIFACPVAFGETGMRERIRNVLRYKKPAVWVTAIALAATVVCGICFLTAQPAEAVRPDDSVTEPKDSLTKPDESADQKKETSEIKEPVLQYFPNGVAYTIRTVDVRSSHIRLEIMAYLENGEQLQMYHIPRFWLEEKTDTGWDPLPVKDPEVQWSQTLIRLTGYTNPNTEVKGCDYAWSAQWNELYGLLPVGNYRIGLWVAEGTDPYYVEFSLEESQLEGVSKELEYCRQAVQKILDSSYYQVMVQQTSELLSIEPNSGNEHLLGNPTVMYNTIIKSGENYLSYALDDKDENYVPLDGSMKKDGVTYRLDNVVEWDRTSGVAGWSVWSDPGSDRFTWWVDGSVIWNAQRIDDICVEDDMVTFYASEGPESERTETEYTFFFNDNSTLERICKTTRMNNYSGFEAEYVSVFDVTILSVNDPQVSAWIDEQDVNFYREFSWSADVSKYGLSGTVQEENISAKRITTAPEAIAAAEKHSDKDHTKIVVYRDQASGMWKVEYQRNYGARGYLYIYLDDTGYYYGSAEGERRT